VFVDLHNKLMRIGFTDFEARIYITLLREYPVTSYQIAKETEQPRSTVSETLSDMLDRGVVLETLERRATLYRPLPPLMLLAQHEAEHSRMLTELRDSLEELYQDNQDDRVWSISGRTAVLNYAAEMIQYAETDLFLVLSDEDLRKLRMEIEGACARDLPVSTLLTGEAELSCGSSAYHTRVDMNESDLSSTLLVAVDGGELLISNHSPREEMKATITRNADLNFLARQVVWLQLNA
jgi:Cd2+/Zn2+-exporting ATPase